MEHTTRAYAFALTAIAAAAGSATPALAVHVYEGKTAAQVADFAARPQFDGVAKIEYDFDFGEVFGPGWGVETVFAGSATLISDRWMLTAAHVVDDLPSDYRFQWEKPDGTVLATASAAQTFVHPGWGGSGTIATGGNDIALVYLDRPVTDVPATPIYTGSNERFRWTEIIGYGEYRDESGSIQPGPLKRGGQNKLDIVDGPSTGFNVWGQFAPDVMIADYDDPANEGLPWNDPQVAWPINPTGTTDLTNFEAMLGPGDSGGGAFISEDGVRYLAGVNSFVTTWNPDEFGFIQYEYNDVSGFARVSYHQDWIFQTMAIPAPGVGGLLGLAGVAALRRRR